MLHVAARIIGSRGPAIIRDKQRQSDPLRLILNGLTEAKGATYTRSSVQIMSVIIYASFDMIYDRLRFLRQASCQRFQRGILRSYVDNLLCSIWLSK